jgi:hypothetical protein
LGNLDGTAAINRSCENIRVNINISTEGTRSCRLKLHNPLFYEECSKILNKRKQDKLQWLQNPSQIRGDNMDNARSETSRTYKKKTLRYFFFVTTWG